VPELTILAAFAHPDDETILAGGTLAMLADRGAQLNLLLATRGEGGELGKPPTVHREELGAQREQELRCAAEVLGATSVLFLDYIDPLMGEDEALHPFEADFETLAQEIGAAIKATKADVLITHGSNGEYGHPAHVWMHRACLHGLQTSTGTATPLFTISANFPDHPRPRLANKDDHAHFILNVEPWLSIKLKAAECHRTQGSLFVRRSSKEAGQRLTLDQVLLKVESLHRAWPPLESLDEDSLTQFIRARCLDVVLLDRMNQPTNAT
jgi:LmbE family N-acetylglucosaminyl deacetylase